MFLLMRGFACLRCVLLAVGLAGGSSVAHGAESAGVVAGPALKWDVSLWGKPRAGTVVADALASEVAQRTEGRWRLALHYGEALSKARENLDGLEIGAFEAAMFCNFYHPRKTAGADGADAAVPAHADVAGQPPHPRRRLRASRGGQGARALERAGVHVVVSAALRVPGAGRATDRPRRLARPHRSRRRRPGAGDAAAGRHAGKFHRHRGVHGRAARHHGRGVLSVHLQPCRLPHPRGGGLVHRQPRRRHGGLSAGVFPSPPTKRFRRSTGSCSTT